MGKRSKLLDKMRSNPKGDWTINDLLSVAASVRDSGFTLSAPKRGSHYTARHPDVLEILTIPARKPIKPIYVKRFVSMIDSITKSELDDQ